MEDQSVGDTNNLQQYKIERRRKWEERYNCVIITLCIMDYSFK